MIATTHVVSLERSEWKEKADLVRAAMPFLVWRLRDFGCLEADLDEERELSIHVWHPSLSPPKEWTGMVHDHSYFLRSCVLAGEITNHEVLVKPCGETFQSLAWARVVATRSMQGLVSGVPLREPVWIDRLAPQKVGCGHQYSMPMGSFHETSVTETTVTLMHRLDLVKGRDLSVLIPYGSPLVRDPKPSIPSHEWLLERGFEALAKKPWNL